MIWLLIVAACGWRVQITRYPEHDIRPVAVETDDTGEEAR